jgi:hypothetical protein
MANSQRHVEWDGETFKDLFEEDPAQIFNREIYDSPWVGTELSERKSRLEKQFLDRFAELLSSKKDYSHVAATAMKFNAAGNEATIYVARNRGFYRPDKHFWKRLTRCMEELSKVDCESEFVPVLEVSSII